MSKHDFVKHCKKPKKSWERRKKIVPGTMQHINLMHIQALRGKIKNEVCPDKIAEIKLEIECLRQFIVKQAEDNIESLYCRFK